MDGYRKSNTSRGASGHERGRGFGVSHIFRFGVLDYTIIGAVQFEYWLTSQSEAILKSIIILLLMVDFKHKKVYKG